MCFKSNVYVGAVAWLLLSVSGCAHGGSSVERACQQAPTLSTPLPSERAAWLPWEVDELATPLPGELSLDVHESPPEFEPPRDTMTTSVALFYMAFRRTWGKFDMTRCDLHPSCSRFALEAARHVPLWAAVPMAFARIMRNHNASSLPRDAQGRKRDPVSHYTFARPALHDDATQEVYMRSISWSQHARAIKHGCVK